MQGNKTDLSDVYLQSLEKNIIQQIAKEKGLDNRIAMEIYYKSELSGQIAEGLCGIQYLDYKNLAEDLMENERELFSEFDCETAKYLRGLDDNGGDKDGETQDNDHAG